MTVTAQTLGRVVQFIWNNTTVTFDYPSSVDEPRFWVQPQAGSELGPVNDSHDAWVVGRDWMAAVTLRFLTETKWQEVQAFLDWASVGGAFSFVPDAVNAPLFVIPGCLLVTPFGDPNVGLEDNGLQMVEITFRNSTYDLGLAWRS